MFKMHSLTILCPNCNTLSSWQLAITICSSHPETFILLHRYTVYSPFLSFLLFTIGILLSCCIKNYKMKAKQSSFRYTLILWNFGKKDKITSIKPFCFIHYLQIQNFKYNIVYTLYITARNNKILNWITRIVSNTNKTITEN